MSMSLHKHKLLRNKNCGSSNCHNLANKRVLFSLGFSALFCEKCADELIQNNLGVEEGHALSSAEKTGILQNGGYNRENE